ncbi:TRAP transporter small permease [Salmonella enterica subsp. enterica serovar Newport]|nr:TRAP transporter small permease [Salmonella enterica subsp. enterica]EBX4816873.1 TRAP transporter small permease [Salmonella enterica subsp. enterica serovar Newport]
MTTMENLDAVLIEEAPEAVEEKRGVTDKLMEWVCVLLLGATTLLVLANALSRYILHKPLPWSEELVINMMVWLGAAGMVLATMRGLLITCDIVTMRLSPRLARGLNIATTLFSAVVMGIFSWLTYQYLMIFGGDLTPVLRIPKGWVIAGLLFTTAGVTLALLARLFRK